MILYPAIDILDGRAVRLTQGEYGSETAYEDDPVVAAVRWARAGATWLHVVDLDGAKAGEPVNLSHVRRIVAAVDVPIQLGGGLRDSGKVEEAFSTGVERVVLGTAAIRDPEMAGAIASVHGDRVVGAVDARGGKVAAEGWTEPGRVGPAELASQLRAQGIERLIYTPVEVDGTMEGPDVASMRAVAEASDAELIYSGGIGSLEDLRMLAGLGIASLGGVIVGRALYEGRFGVAEARAALA